jgi:ATP-binding cassette subfamily F protein 3
MTRAPADPAAGSRHVVGTRAAFDGDLDDYRNWVLERARRGTRREDAGARIAAAAERRTQRREEAAARQRRSDARKPLLTRQAVLEQDLARLGAEKAALD